MLSASQLPWFTVLPPAGYGVLTTTGRKTGKTRRKCVRAIRSGDRAFVASIGGESNAWVKNARANPEVRLRIRGGKFTGVARDPTDDGEAQRARQEYCDTLKPFDYASCLMHREGRPTRTKIQELLREWFDTGTPLVVELRK